MPVSVNKNLQIKNNYTDSFFTEACGINITSSTHIMKDDKHISYIHNADQIKETAMLLFVFCKIKGT